MRIALIEESRGDAYLFHVILKQVDSSVSLEIHTSGRLALKAFQNRPAPDIVISDWFLPLLSFPEFLEGMRTLPGGYADVPVAVFTVTESQLSERRIAELGVISCLTKPPDKSKLDDLLKRIRLLGARPAIRVVPLRDERLPAFPLMQPDGIGG